MNHKIKAIFFDLDGVLTLNKSGTAQTCKYISEKSGIDYDLLKKSVSSLNTDVGLGYEKYSEILPKINSLINYEIDEKLLKEAFLSTPKNEKMFDLAKKIKDSGLKVGVITDNPSERMNVLRNLFNMDQIFDAIITSSKVHGFKDSPLIFEKALDSLDINPLEAIFIDNSEKNLKIPSDMGIHAIYYDDQKNDIDLLISNLERLKVL